jgi:hypothetical protein
MLLFTIVPSNFVPETEDKSRLSWAFTSHNSANTVYFITLRKKHPIHPIYKFEKKVVLQKKIVVCAICTIGAEDQRDSPNLPLISNRDHDLQAALEV